MDKVTICVDAMGGDNAPGVVLEGVEAALRADEDLEVILVGPQDVVETFADGHDRCTAAFASEVIEMGSTPPMPCAARRILPSWLAATW